MYQLISKEWGLENGVPMRLEHYVADSKEDVLPEAPTGSDCLYPDGSKAVRFAGGWVIVDSAAMASLSTKVTVTGQGENLLTGSLNENLLDLEVRGLINVQTDPTPSVPVTPAFSEGLYITCGESEAEIGDVTLRRVGDVADSLMLDGRIIRRIGVYAITGKETFTKMNESYFSHCYTFVLAGSAIGLNTSVCSHFKNVSSAFSIAVGAVGYYCDHIKQKNRYFDSDLDTVEAFTAWLTAEYEKGTPVTLWYVLENEVIEEANEDLAAALSALRLSLGTTAFSVADGKGSLPLYRVTYEKTAQQELDDLRAKTEELTAAIAAIG